LNTQNQQKVIITGAASGIGRALALEYARHGYRLGLIDRNEDALLDLKTRMSCDNFGKDQTSSKNFVRTQTSSGNSVEAETSNFNSDKAQTSSTSFVKDQTSSESFVKDQASSTNFVQDQTSSETIVQVLDVTDTERARAGLAELIRRMGGCHLLILCAGIGPLDPDLDWKIARDTIDVNVRGFAAMAQHGMQHFLAHGGGHLVGISSLAAVRGDRHAPSYNASKAFVSLYLEGLRNKVKKEAIPIQVTDIRPGFVDTPGANSPVRLWEISPEAAAKKIFRAVRRKKRIAYIPWRWRFVAGIWRSLPSAIVERM